MYVQTAVILYAPQLKMAGHNKNISPLPSSAARIDASPICKPISVGRPSEVRYEGPAKIFVTGFGLLQYMYYILSNIFLLQTFKVFPLYWNTFL